MIDADTSKTIQFVGFAKDGAWPVAGGTLDQTEWFLDAYEYVRREEK